MNIQEASETAHASEKQIQLPPIPPEELARLHKKHGTEPPDAKQVKTEKTPSKREVSQTKARPRKDSRLPDHQIVNGLRRVFGYYPTKEGEKFAFMEVEEQSYQGYRRLASKSGLSVGEEIALAIEKGGSVAVSTGRRCGPRGKEAF